jgi:hypothetical protein
MRRVLAGAAVGVLALYAAVAVLGGQVMPSYLAAWLFCLSIPVGALPIVFGLELAGLGGARHTGCLRWPLLLLPVAALAGLPILLFLPALYPWAAHPMHGLAGAWWSPTWFGVRTVLYLAVWSALALLSLRPPAAGPRVALCCAGLVLHAVIGTLAATDWIMSLAPGLNAAGFGLLVMAGQSALALGVAFLLVPARPGWAASWLVAAVVVWSALQFTQYLIVWSANQPAEIAWYIQRGDTLGVIAAWGGAASLVLCIALLGPAWLAGRRFVLTSCAAVVVLVQMDAALWLVTPSIRGRFVLDLPDLALPMLAVLSGVFLWALRPRAVPA